MYLAHQFRTGGRVETVEEISNHGQIIAISKLGLEGASWNKVVPITKTHLISILSGDFQSIFPIRGVHMRGGILLCH